MSFNIGADIIDSRDIIARIEELEGDRDSHSESPEKWAEEYADDAEELAMLLKFQEECEGYCSDWPYGASLIEDSYFEKYARELADDLGCIDAAAGWPTNCIDWEQAAKELQQDYTSADIGGYTYWFR